MTDEDTFDPEELREAEALARALERGTAHDALPEDALQTAALLRYGAGSGVLAEARERAILEDVLAAAERVAARRPVARPWRAWAAIVGVALAAGLVVLVLRRPGDERLPSGLPPPSAALVEAQLARLEDPSADARFDAEMRDYRGSVYAALEARYGAR